MNSCENKCSVDGVPERTALYDFHAEHGARFVPFAGWEMPVSYGPILEEHRATREQLGLFDVSHMGEVKVIGKDATKFLNHLLVNDVSKMGIGGATYSPMCKEDGGVIDDLITYQMSEDEYLICVNACNAQVDYEWMEKVSVSFECEVTNVSSEYGQLAIQGPNAVKVLQEIVDFDLSEIKRFRFVRKPINGAEMICSRTGYTGEDGFELYCPPDHIRKLADDIVKHGEPEGLKLIGLGARDTLRLEAGYPLYGHEISEYINPLQAGLGWTVKWEKDDFIGKSVLLEEKEGGIPYRVVHFTISERRIARDGTLVLANDVEVGKVLSSGFSPMTGTPIGSALIESGASDDELVVDIRGTKVSLNVKKPPLHI
jgi:aminomethyltransferase